MSAKPEETVAPAATTTEAAAPAISEKQPEAAPAPDTTEKKEETATEEKKIEEAAPAPASAEKKEEPTNSENKVEEATAAVAAAPIPATTGPAPTSSPEGSVWPETPAEHPLTKFFETFEELVKESGHNEVFGVTLSKDKPFHTKLILQKFLRANANDLTKAKEQLLDTLKWRKEFDPAKAADASYEKEKFDGLGWILEVNDVPGSANKKDIVTFNIYGAVKDNQKTFGDLDAFIQWRVGLMERSVQKLDLANATKLIPNYQEGPDPYQGYQIHDYLQVSFIRQDPVVKAAVKRTIDTLGRYYPETLSRKFFVNVPVLMGWMYAAAKLIVPKETAKKFTVVSYGNQLAAELGPNTPKEYGGTAGELKEVGEGMKMEA